MDKSDVILSNVKECFSYHLITRKEKKRKKNNHKTKISEHFPKKLKEKSATPRSEVLSYVV